MKSLTFLVFQAATFNFEILLQPEKMLPIVVARSIFQFATSTYFKLLQFAKVDVKSDTFETSSEAASIYSRF